MTRKYRRRPKKTDTNIYILVSAAAIAVLVMASLGSDANRVLTSGIMIMIVGGLGLTTVLVWLLYRGITLKRRRQAAVTGENVDGMSWKDFEFFVVRLLKTQGFSIKQHSSAPGDQGADIIAAIKRDKYAIQVKHYSHKLDNTPVQEAVAAKAIYGCNCSMVVTNSHFTAAAYVLAAANNCVLVDRETLGRWILEATSKGSNWS